MKKYYVEITETLQKQIPVVTDSEEEAIKIIREKYKGQGIILTSEDYIDTEFSIYKTEKVKNEIER